MTFKHVYLITKVSSNGFDNGRESFTRFNENDPDFLIGLVYKDYIGEFNEAMEEGILDDKDAEALSEKEFAKLMKAGFCGNDDVALIQCVDHHVQYEAFSISLIEDPPNVSYKRNAHS